MVVVVSALACGGFLLRDVFLQVRHLVLQLFDSLPQLHDARAHRRTILRHLILSRFSARPRKPSGTASVGSATLALTLRAGRSSTRSSSAGTASARSASARSTGTGPSSATFAL